MIKHVKGGHKVWSSRKHRYLSTKPKSYRAAAAQLGAVERSKKARGDTGGCKAR